MSGSNVESALSHLHHETRLDSLRGALQPLSKIIIRSSELSESRTPFLLDHSHRAKLTNSVFCLAVATRVVYPVHPNRTKCALCAMDADESTGHDLVCCAPSEKRASNRHTGVLNALIEGLKSGHINSELIKILTAQANYADNFAPKTTIPAAPFLEDEDVQPPATNGQPGAATGKISHPDLTVVKHALNDLTDGKKILVDVTITGPNTQNRNKAQITAGAMAQAAELRKIQQVHARWNVAAKPNIEFRPFAIENMGGFGVYARDFLYEMLDIPKPPPLEAQTHAAVSKRLERTAKLDALQSIKASIVAAVWRGNHYIYTEYTRALKALIPPPGVHQPGED